MGSDRQSRGDPGSSSAGEGLSPSQREELVTAHLGLARQLARRFDHRGEPLDDLVQVASLGLVTSARRFDPDRGVEFSAFATRTIIGELKRHFRDKGWAVRASRRVYRSCTSRLGHATASLSQQLGRAPSVAELARETGASEEAVLESLEAGQGYRAASIDASQGDDSNSLVMVPAPKEELEITQLRMPSRRTLSSISRTPGRRLTVSDAFQNSHSRFRQAAGGSEARKRRRGCEKSTPWVNSRPDCSSRGMVALTSLPQVLHLLQRRSARVVRHGRGWRRCRGRDRNADGVYESAPEVEKNRLRLSHVQLPPRLSCRPNIRLAATGYHVECCRYVWTIQKSYLIDMDGVLVRAP